MSSFNRVVIVGNVCRDPELRATPSGQQVCDVSVAVNEKWDDKSGTTQERVTFVDVTMWGKTAETFCRWKKKGDPVLVEGRLQQDNWTDKESGKKRSKLKVQADRIVFLGGKEAGESGGKSKPARKPEPQGNTDDGYATEMPPADSEEPAF
jgi:single-strand DNA-binding protein